MANNDYETAQEIKSAHAQNVINLFQRSIEIMDDLFECPRFKAELHGIEQKFKDSKATYQEIDRFARDIAKLLINTTKRLTCIHSRSRSPQMLIHLMRI